MKPVIKQAIFEFVKGYVADKERVSSKEIKAYLPPFPNIKPQPTTAQLSFAVSSCLRSLGFEAPSSSLAHSYLDPSGIEVREKMRVWDRQIAHEDAIATLEREELSYDQTVEYFQEKASQAEDMKASREAQVKIASLQNKLNFFTQIASEFDDLSMKIPSTVYHDPEKRQNRVDAYAVLSDVHPGKVTTLDQSFGFNQFNPEIATYRLKKYWENLRQLLVISSQTEAIDTVHLLLLGDMLENRYMHSQEATHASMSVSQELSFMFESCFSGINLIVDAMQDRANKFVISCISGNHDRIPNHRRTPMSNRTEESLVTFLYNQLAFQYRDQKHIEFKIPSAEGLILDSFGYKTLAVHGDSMQTSKANGLLVPSRNYMENKVKPLQADHLVYGHFHHRFVNHKFTGNSSICGPDAYTIGLGFELVEPTQSFWLVSENYQTVVNQTPIFLR